MQTESHVVKETMKEILLKKGSKCKCPQQQLHDMHEKQRCGNYCKNLSGKQQKKIVKRLMLAHYKKTQETAKQNNQQLNQDPNPYFNQADFGVLDEKKFIIDAAWWRQWCDYVNFTPESNTPALRPSASYIVEDNELNESLDSEQPFQRFIDKNYLNSARKA